MNEIDWDVLWVKFELWHSDEERKRRHEVCDACGMRASYAPDPEWEEQQEKITELVAEALK